MPPKSPNDNSAYESKVKLDLDKLKNGQTQNAKVNLTKVNIVMLNLVEALIQKKKLKYL